MKLKSFFKLLIITVGMFATEPVKAQSCGSCTLHISHKDTSVYTVSAGQIICIDSLGIFTGSLVLNGGTVCNKGVFNPKALTVSSGTINNYSRIITPGNFNLGSGVTLVNASKSITTVKGDLIVSGGSFTNSGIANIKNNITFSSGTITNSAILNYKLLSGTGVISNSGIINQD